MEKKEVFVVNVKTGKLIRGKWFKTGRKVLGWGFDEEVFISSENEEYHWSEVAKPPRKNPT